MKKFLALFLTAVLLSAALPASAKETGLAFREDGSFRILQISDPQDDAFPAWDMLNLLKTAVKTADPDLIVLSGDLVEDKRVGDLGIDGEPGREGVNVTSLTGELNAEKTRLNAEKAVDAVMRTLEPFGVPVAVALGNNDRKVGLTGADWIEILSRYDNCVIFDESADEADGVDYHLTVSGANGGPAFNVWLMDTLRGGISDEQVDWYRAASKEMTAANGGEPIPAMVFQHIQAPDIGNLFVPCSPADTGARRVKDGWVRLNTEIAGGYNFYGWEPGVTSYEFAAWKECGDVIGAYFGHQHVEGFSGVWDGVEMGFTYGCEMAKTSPYGFRVITLHEDDIASYENVLYRYTGNVRLGTAAVQAETVSSSAAPAAFAPMLHFFNLFRSLFSALVYLFS